MSTSIPLPTPASAAVLRQVQRLCADKKLRFTAIRRDVLALLLEQKTPCKAYALLERLPSGGYHPTAVYRALDFLLQNGFAHKIHTQNGYVACRHPQHAHDCYFLICRHCNKAEECCNSNAARAISNTVKKNHYRQPEAVVEILAACKKCARR